MSEPCWMPFSHDLKVPIFMGQNLCQVITLVNQNELCGHWYPIPGGAENSYLVVSVASIQKLAKSSRHKEEVWNFQNNFIWDIRGKSLSEPCVECIAQPSKCCKKTQALPKRKDSFLTRILILRRKRKPPLIKNEGAVVFATKRKDDKTLGVNENGEKGLRYWTKFYDDTIYIA